MTFRLMEHLEETNKNEDEQQYRLDEVSAA